MGKVVETVIICETDPDELRNEINLTIKSMHDRGLEADVRYGSSVSFFTALVIGSIPDSSE